VLQKPIFLPFAFIKTLSCANVQIIPVLPVEDLHTRDLHHHQAIRPASRRASKAGWPESLAGQQGRRSNDNGEPERLAGHRGWWASLPGGQALQAD
jgi:hypothetical protein